MKVFVVVLNYKGRDDTKACTLSLLNSSYKEKEIVLVDNHSCDGSADFFRELFPRIIVLETGSNLGYAGGNNVGVRYALQQGADAILILNNDTVLKSDCIEKFVEESKLHPKSVLGGRVYYYDDPKVMQEFGGIWDNGRGKFRNVPHQDFDANVSHNLDFVTGCALFVPREIFEVAGLIEESFFLYYEEIDWCFQVRRKGYFCTYVPSPILWHKESRSFATPKPPQSYFQWRNRILFIERNFSRKYYIFWMLTKFPHRFCLLLIKMGVKHLDSLIFKSSYEKRVSLLSYKASLKGIYDYFRRSFGNGPAWIFTKVK